MDKYTQKVIEIPPVFSEVGHQDQQYEVIPLEGVELEAGLHQRDADEQLAESYRIAALWQAAHDLEYAAISGSAIGLLAMGVLQGKPKSIAVQNWIRTIWEIYYVRKANGSTDTDYSTVGVCPHSVPELMTELGV